MRNIDPSILRLRKLWTENEGLAARRKSTSTRGRFVVKPRSIGVKPQTAALAKSATVLPSASNYAPAEWRFRR